MVGGKELGNDVVNRYHGWHTAQRHEQMFGGVKEGGVGQQTVERQAT